MHSTNTVVLALDDDDLSAALGCSSEAVAALQDNGILEYQGELWEIGAARNFLRDAAWADNLWH
jgi:hypothetical protein